MAISADLKRGICEIVAVAHPDNNWLKLVSRSPMLSLLASSTYYYPASAMTDCSSCSAGYSPQLGFACNDCSDSVGGIVLATLILAGGLVTAVTVISYLISGQSSNKRPGLVQRLARYIPLQSVKIIIVAWQILTQVCSRNNSIGE